MAKYLVGDYTNIIPKVFMGFSAVVFIIIIIAFIGLGLGLVSCKKDPELRTKWGDISYYFFMVTVFLAFVFTPIYLIPGSLLFAIGAPISMLCEPIADLTIFDEVCNTFCSFMLSLLR